MAANNDAPPFTNIRTLGVKAFDLRKNNRAILISAINLYRKLVISIYRYYYSIAAIYNALDKCPDRCERV